MTFPSFLESTFDAGQAVVPAPAEISDKERSMAARVLIEHERVWRNQLPVGLPEFDPECGMWAAETLYRAAQFLAHRDVNVEFIDAAFAEPPPGSRSAAAHYSVDLCFRYLRDIWRLAGLASTDDPFSDRLVRLVGPWPLSAVGFHGLDLVAEKTLLNQPAMRRIYVDRILSRAKPSQVKDPELRELVSTAIGAFPQLAPGFASAFAATEEETNGTEA